MNRQYDDLLDDDFDQDLALAETLSLLDPESRDPSYWLRFRSWVLTGASRELARRRLLAQLTIGDVVQSWARAVVPTAVLTAVLASLLLIRSGFLAPPKPIGVEEMLVSEIEGETLPAMLAPDPATDPVTFASESF
jgi:hypothetical protein